MCSHLFFNLNPLEAYFINQSHNPGKLTTQPVTTGHSYSHV